MNEAPRLFGPRIAKRKLAPNDTPKLAVDSLGEEAAHVSGKDSEICRGLPTDIRSQQQNECKASEFGVRLRLKGQSQPD